MKKITLYLLPAAMLVCLFSCKPNRQELLIGKWRSVKIENKDKDNFFQNSQRFIDTMGKGNDDATNMDIYGVTNMDSLRKELQMQFDSAYAAQLNMDTQSLFQFNGDSTVLLSFPGRTETGMWFIDEKGKLILEEEINADMNDQADAGIADRSGNSNNNKEQANKPKQTERLVVDIATIDENTMKLVFVREIAEGLSDTSSVTFVKEKK